MSVTVTIRRASDGVPSLEESYADGRGLDVRDHGALVVLDSQSASANPVAVYAAGEWLAAHCDEAREIHREPMPGVRGRR